MIFAMAALSIAQHTSDRNLHLLDVQPDAIPEELTTRNRWCCWRAQPDERGHVKKRPVAPDGSPASPTNNRTWSSFGDAFAGYVRNGFDGIGLMVGSPHLALDLDHATTEDGSLRPEATALVQESASYAEWSPSGSGAHIWLNADVPDLGNRKTPEFEVFTRHFLTVTGHPLPGVPFKVQPAPAGILARLPKPNLPTQDAPTLAAQRLPDEELLSRAFRAKNGEKFAHLWSGDTTGYKSPSEADLALAQILAFWSGKNYDQMLRLFMRSALWHPKCLTKRGDSTYISATLLVAIRTCKAVWHPAVSPERAAILAVLRAAGRPMRIIEVASVLQANPHTVLVGLGRMEKAGLVAKAGRGRYGLPRERHT